MKANLELRQLIGLPSDLLTALGEVAARYGQIEHILTLTIRRTAKPEISWDEAFERVKKLSRKDIRKEVKRCFEWNAIGEFGETEGARCSEQFNHLLEEWIGGGLADRRDDVVHCCWSIKNENVTNTRKGELLEVDGHPAGIEAVKELANDLKHFLIHLNRATMPESLSGPKEEIAAFPPTYFPGYIVSVNLETSSTAAAMPVFMPPGVPPRPSGD